MPEVISLISSSPKLPEPALPPVSHPRRPETETDILPDDLEGSLFDYSDFDKPAKRCKLTPHYSRSKKPISPSNTPDSLFAFLSSEGASALHKEQISEYKRCTNSDLYSDNGSDPMAFTVVSTVTESRQSVRDPHVNLTDYLTLDEYSLDNIGGALPTAGGPLSFSQPIASKTYLSDRTTNLLATIESRCRPSSSNPKSGSGVTRKPVARGSKSNARLVSENECDVVPLKPASSKRSSKALNANIVARGVEREAAKARREKEREEEKERKRKIREEKAKERQLAADIAEVNKLKVDKKNSTPEMLVDVSSSLEGSSIGNQTAEFMRRLGVEMSFVSTRIPNLIRWRRKITATYNNEAGHWEPSPLEIKHEAHVLCFLSAQEFVDMAVATVGSDDSKTLEDHVLKITGTYPDSKPIYLIEGLTALMRKSQNSRNRAYQEAVLRELDGANNTARPQAQSKRPKKTKKPDPPQPIDDDMIEDALLQLQVNHACLIHHTSTPGESAEWIKNFTEHISTIPYRQEMMNAQDAAFCMEVGQVRCGEDKADTYVKMLQEVHRVTAPMAYGIATQYPTVRELVSGMKEQGPLMLENIPKCANRNGDLTNSRIGPAASRRLYKVFTGLDPESTDI